jgi:hypothetical protein
MHNAIAELRAVLHGWSQDQYPDCELKVVAYLLAHRYSGVNLTMGTLKGEDAHKISHLRPVAEELGYIICLATLFFTKIDPADDCGGRHVKWNYWCRKRRRRCGYEDEDDLDEGVPEVAEVTDTCMSITDLVDLDGVQIVKKRPLSLTRENLIPANAFDEDDSNNEGYVCHSPSLSVSHLTYESPSSFTGWQRHSTL